MNIQFKKGVLELCVLSMLQEKDRYGYELVSEVSKNVHIAEGTIYPLLKRLRDEKYVTTYLVESKEGPSRKYYSLSTRGRTACLALIDEWEDFVEGINTIVGKGVRDNE